MIWTRLAASLRRSGSTSAGRGSRSGSHRSATSRAGSGRTSPPGGSGGRNWSVGGLNRLRPPESRRIPAPRASTGGRGRRESGVPSGPRSSSPSSPPTGGLGRRARVLLGLRASGSHPPWSARARHDQPGNRDRRSVSGRVGGRRRVDLEPELDCRAPAVPRARHQPAHGRLRGRSSQSGCNLGSLSFNGPQTDGGGDFVVPANGHLAVDLSGAVSMDASAVNACQGRRRGLSEGGPMTLLLKALCAWQAAGLRLLGRDGRTAATRPIPRRHAGLRRLMVLSAGLVAALGLTSIALAYLTASTTGGSNGRSLAGSIGAPSTRQSRPTRTTATSRSRGARPRLRAGERFRATTSFAVAARRSAAPSPHR